MVEQFLRIHSFLPFSRCNGPGVRAVVWVQGCSRRCPGCYNPQTHPRSGGRLVDVDWLFGQIISLKGRIQGITISGGEPLEQIEPILRLLRRIKDTGLSVLLFSGYEWHYIQKMPESRELLSCVDIIIAGPYVQEKRLAKGLRGSDNKTVHFLTERYRHEDLDSVPSSEVIITPEGEIIISGIEPILLP